MAQTERLRQALAELESQLQDLDTLDPETQAMLRSAAAEINEKLNQRPADAPTPERPTTSPETASLEGSLRERVVGFEASHPRLAMLLNRVIDLLGQAGI